MEDNTGETHFYIKLKEMEEDNSALREEIAKLDDKNLLLQRMNTCLKRQLEEVRKRYEELQREYDKLKIVLDEVREKEKMEKIALKKSINEKQIMITKLEAAELEVLEVEGLKEKLKKATNERLESMKKVTEMIKTLDEEHNKCEFLEKLVKELKETNERLQNICESRENTIQVLREKNRELVEENAELQLIDTNRFSLDRDSMTPNSDTESYIYRESNGVVHQDSLYAELKASGFTNDSINRQLEDQVHWYELEINTLLKQMEPAFEQLLSTYGEERFRLCATQNVLCAVSSEKIQNFETLKKRIQILLDMFTVTPKISDVDIQLRADSKETGDLNEVLNSHDHLEHALTGNGSFNALTVNENSHEEIVPVRSDILNKDEDLPLGTSLMGSKDSKLKNKAMSEQNLSRGGNVSRKKYFNTTQHALEFTNANIESYGITILGSRRSKSESSLIIEKKPSLFPSHSFNVIAMSLSPRKTRKIVETREKQLCNSISKERNLKNVKKTKEQNGVQNLTSWEEYKFGGTYRCLNDDSTDSSICSMSSRHNSLLGSEDLSLNEPCQQKQCEFCPLYLAPTKLKRLPSKSPSLLQEKCFSSANMDRQSIDSNKGIIYDRCTVDERSISPCQMFSNFCIRENFTAFSTPLQTNSKNKNFSMCKKDTKLSSARSTRRSSCGSLIQKFVDLDISNETNDLVNMQTESYLDKTNYNDQKFENVNSTYTERTKDRTDSIRESTHETLFDRENYTNGFEKSVHVNLSHIEELQDILEKIENSPEENNNVLQSSDLYTSNSVKSNEPISDAYQSFKEKITDPSEKRLCTLTNNISSMPSLRVLISCAFVFILGYCLNDVIPLWNTSSNAPCRWYSFEEILNQYFPIRNRKLRPL